MTTMTRRSLFGLSALAVAGAVTGCSGSKSDGQSASGGAGSLQWWDHFSSFQTLNDDWSTKESKALGLTVTHTYNGAGTAQQALQLAHQAEKLPDFYSNVVGLPLAALVSGGWVHEVELPEDIVSQLPEGTLTDGITSLDKKNYGIPLFSLRQSSTLTWMNSDLFQKAGVDPNNPPTDYDGFKDVCRRLSAAKVTPMTMAIGGDGGRVRDQVDDMAQSAGFAGYQGLKFTGEYAYHDNSYVTVIEFLKELNDAKYLLPGSTNLDVVNARTRFAAGAVGIFIDGIWCPGGSKALVPSFVDKIAFGPTLVPRSGMNSWFYRGRPAPSYFVSKATGDLEGATKLALSLMTEEYQKGMIAAMDQPPLNLDLVAEAAAIDAYKKGVAFCKGNVFLMPQAIVQNPQIAAVDAKRKPVSPDLGAIIQGYLGGSITDLASALKKLSDANEADRNQALASAKSSGAKVSENDYVFTDWKPGQDYKAGGN